MSKEYFAWLRSLNELDKYNAALDISTDYAGDQTQRLEADDYLRKLNRSYENVR